MIECNFEVCFVIWHRDTNEKQEFEKHNNHSFICNYLNFGNPLTAYLQKWAERRQNKGKISNNRLKMKESHHETADMNNFLLELLIDPLTREPLVFDSASNSLISTISKNKYPIINTIPKILVDENLAIAKSDLHQEYSSKFSYMDHYQKDAELFCYSEQKTSAVIKNELSRLRESIVEEISDDLSIILDVGCGGGWASKKLVPLGKKVISMDISSNNPINAIQEVQHINHAGLIADAYNIPIKDESIDCIIASEILEHVPDPKKFISGLLRILKSSGKLIITTPYDEKIEYYLCVHCNKPTPKSAHLHSFNEINIIQFVPSEGIIWSSKKFINKYLIKIRSHIILKSIPYKYWKRIDNLFNRLVDIPTRLRIVIQKKV